MRNYVKALSTIIVGVFVLGDINAKPWNNNTREHLFGYIGADNRANVSIQDEGFRWRNSFNFTINGQQISAQNWWFMPVIDYDIHAGFTSSNTYYNNYSPNLIHFHLAKIADQVKTINECASASVAAITIVVENGGSYYAFSKLLCNDIDQIIAARTLRNNDNVNGFISYPDVQAAYIKDMIEQKRPTIDSNIPNPHKYSCSEGQIITTIKDNNLDLIKRIIKELLLEAKR